jgi:TonB family protein
MKPDTLETICFSFILHLGLLLSFSRSPEVNTPPKIEVTVVEKSSSGQKPLKPPSSSKRAKSLDTENKSAKSNINELGTKESAEENEPVDLSEYANRVKIKIDPIWTRKIRPYLRDHTQNINLEVLVKINSHGRITAATILKTSGNVNVDKIALDTFREANSLPKPPNSKEILEDGIIWEFNF